MKKLFLILLLIATPAYAETCFNIDSSAWTQEEKNMRQAGAYDLVYAQNTVNLPPSSVSDSQICFPSLAVGTTLSDATLRARIDQIIVDSEPTPAKISAERKRRAKEYIESSNAPEMVALRSVIRTLYGSLAEVRSKNNLQNRTWQQAIDSVKADIDAGNGEV